MQIYLLRHGIAENASPGQPDSERALTAEGREKLRRVLKRARSAEVNPGAILSSPYKRALETAEVAAEALDSRAKSSAHRRWFRRPRPTMRGRHSARAAPAARSSWPATSL